MQKEMEKRPNILLITTDTQRVDTLRCMGYPEAVSPNLDRLAEEGILFERAYTAAPACMPARCCLMTGLYSPLHGCIENGIERQEQLPMLTDELKKLGYKTMMFGKTHYGKIPESFDVVETVNGEKGQERNDFYTKYFETNGYSQKFGWPNPVPEENCLDSLIVDRTIYHMEQGKKSETPFFAFCSILSPHSPLDPPKNYEEKYRFRDIEPPHFSKEEWKAFPPSFQDLCGLEEKNTDEPWIERMVEGKGNVADGKSIEEMCRYKALYYASAEWCDALVGRLMDYLDQSGQRENTLILFAADHGQQYFDHGFNDKHTFYEETLHVPFLLSMPSTLPANVRMGFASTVDIAPTLIGAAGGSSWSGNGIDLLKACQTEDALLRNCAVSVIQRNMVLVTQRYKLEYYPEDQIVRLFDLENDPKEDTDQSENPDYANVREELWKALLLWRADLTDVSDIRSRFGKGGPIAKRAIRQLERLNGNECDKNLIKRVAERV